LLSEESVDRYFWEEWVRAYDSHAQMERREQTIRAQVEAGYERGDQLARMQQRMFHVQELVYKKLREKLEEDDLLDWRPIDLKTLVG
jgi:regulator of replication initiation timing